jgi:hypothetical protein
MKSRLSALIACAVTLGSFVACGAPGITDVSSAERNTASTITGFGDKLIKCPSDETVSNTAVVTPLGGLISAGNVTVSIPAGALLADQTVTVTVPASPYVYTEISVEGIDHFLFETPISVSVSYAQCPNPPLGFKTLSAWYVDLDEKELLENMPSVDDKLTRTVTFTTIHLSGYALAD